MVWTFYFLEKLGNTVVAESWRQAHRNRGNHEGLYGLRIAAGCQAPAQQRIHRALERAPGAPHLFLHEGGDIVVEGERGSHIMMLARKAS